MFFDGTKRILFLIYEFVLWGSFLSKSLICISSITFKTASFKSSLDIGFKYLAMDKKLTLSLMAYDIFKNKIKVLKTLAIIFRKKFEILSRLKERKNVC